MWAQKQRVLFTRAGSVHRGLPVQKRGEGGAAISRILSRVVIYLGRPLPADSLLSTHNHDRTDLNGYLLEIAPERVYHAVIVADNAVGSYSTISPLPRPAEAEKGGIFSVALSVAGAS